MDTKKSFDVLSLGEILLRLSPPSNERLVRGDSLRKQTGGAELNVASGIAMLAHGDYFQDPGQRHRLFCQELYPVLRGQRRLSGL